MTKTKVGSDPASIPKEGHGGSNTTGPNKTKPKEGHGGQKHQQKK